MQPINTLSSYYNLSIGLMRVICVGLFLLLAFSACQEEYNHRGKTPLVELKGNFLYKEDLLSVLPVGLSQKDSAQFAERYIQEWLENILLYEKAERNILKDGTIEVLVENYRKSLMVHAYLQALVEQTLSEEVTEEELRDYYNQNQVLFKTNSPLVKGLFIKVPLTAPDVANVRRWYRDNSSDAVEKLEKYSLRNAVKYEYFYDKWMPASEILGLMPFKIGDVDNFFAKNQHVELKDSAYYYFLNISDRRLSGEQEPFEFAERQIRNMLLNVKRADFIKQLRTDLYQQAIQNKDVKFY